MSSQESHLGENNDRLANKKFNYKQCLAAKRGERLPDHLGSEKARHFVVRGIRNSHSFATIPVVITYVRKLFTLSRGFHELEMLG